MEMSIKGAFQKMAEESAPTIEVGMVMELSPLRIQNSDEMKINLSEASVIIPSGKRSLLAVGKEFYFLAVNHGKIYYLLDEV